MAGQDRRSLEERCLRDSLRAERRVKSNLLKNSRLSSARRKKRRKEAQKPPVGRTKKWGLAISSVWGAKIAIKVSRPSVNVKHGLGADFWFFTGQINGQPLYHIMRYVSPLWMGREGNLTVFKASSLWKEPLRFHFKKKERLVSLEKELKVFKGSRFNHVLFLESKSLHRAWWSPGALCENAKSDHDGGGINRF